MEGNNGAENGGRRGGGGGECSYGCKQQIIVVNSAYYESVCRFAAYSLQTGQQLKHDRRK